MEKAITGYDWWSDKERRNEKHMLASQAKRLYSEYWNDYFKFSFVRNPWDRTISMAKSYPGTWHIKLDRSQKPPKLKYDNNFHGYKNRFGYPITIERDRRFYKKTPLKNDRHIENSIYLNLLDEDIDFVGRFENLSEDFSFVAESIGLENPELPHAEKKKHKFKGLHYSEYYTPETKDAVEELYLKDIEHFGYKYD